MQRARCEMLKLSLAALAKVDASYLAQRSFVQLSGGEKAACPAGSSGQQQRVALARSLVKEANILLLDEPLVNLDYKLREQLREEFKNIFSAKASENAILIYSTTDPVEAMQLGGEIIVMDEGRILQLIHKVFSVDAEVITHPVQGTPMVVV